MRNDAAAEEEAAYGGVCGSEVGSRYVRLESVMEEREEASRCESERRVMHGW